MQIVRMSAPWWYVTMCQSCACRVASGWHGLVLLAGCYAAWPITSHPKAQLQKKEQL